MIKAAAPSRPAAMEPLSVNRENVRFGSKADICSAKAYVRSYSKSGHVQCNSACPLCANSGHLGGPKTQPRLRGPVLTNGVLHYFPFFECSFDRQKILMFSIVGMLLDGSASPSKPPTACGANGIFRKSRSAWNREVEGVQQVVRGSISTT
jgi:hypothetical protein